MNAGLGFGLGGGCFLRGGGYLGIGIGGCGGWFDEVDSFGGEFVGRDEKRFSPGSDAIIAINGGQKLRGSTD